MLFPNTKSRGMQIELSDSCLQEAQSSCGCSSDRKGCQCHTTESSPFQLLAQLVTFSVMLSFIFSAPVILTSWTGWVMIWQSSTPPHNIYQHHQTQATWRVCPGFPSSCPAPHLWAELIPQIPATQHSFICSPLPPPPKNCPYYFSSHLAYLWVLKSSV